jgi:hypothetical protein
MIIRIEEPTAENLNNAIERFRRKREKKKKTNYMEFFGALPNIGDGLEFQKNARNEWD